MNESQSGSGSKKSKRKSDGKDEGKPKRCLSAYNLFFQSEREKILQSVPERVDGKPRRSHGKIGFAPLARTIAQRWNALDVHERSIFEEQAAKDKVRYDKEMAEWKTTRAISAAESKKDGIEELPYSDGSTATKKQRYDAVDKEQETLGSIDDEGDKISQLNEEGAEQSIKARYGTQEGNLSIIRTLPLLEPGKEIENQKLLLPIAPRGSPTAIKSVERYSGLQDPRLQSSLNRPRQPNYNIFVPGETIDESLEILVGARNLKESSTESNQGQSTTCEASVSLVAANSRLSIWNDIASLADQLGEDGVDFMTELFKS